jgi:hypothetical protein
MGGTAQTLVMSPTGELLRNWFGAYTGNIQKELEEYFSVQLPGTSEAAPEDQQPASDCRTCEKQSGRLE